MSRRLTDTVAQHRYCKIDTDHASGESTLAHKHCAYVERTCAEIEIATVRCASPCKFVECAPAPASVDIEREQMIQQVIARSYVSKHLLNVFPLPEARRGSFRSAHFAGISGAVIRSGRRSGNKGWRHPEYSPYVSARASSRLVPCLTRDYLHVALMPTTDQLLSLPDADVVRLAQEGRELAFRELVRRYERPVFSLVYRMVRDRELAEDLAQDAFIKVLNHIDRYSPEFKFSSWVFKIANNVAIDHLRRRRLDTISMDGAPDAVNASDVAASTFDVASDQESALDELEARELGDSIEAAIGSLRPEYRSCIMLRHVEGRSYEEIASTLDLPLGTVKTYIHRARHELRRALEGINE